jgi:hypothetical protein
MVAVLFGGGGGGAGNQRPNQKKNMVYRKDPMPELTLTSSYVHSRVDSITFTTGNPMPESTLSPILYFGFGLRVLVQNREMMGI